MGKEYKGPGGVTIDTGDTKMMVFGWAAVVLAVAVGVAVWQLSAAIAAGILILSGCGGISMIIFTGGRVYAGITLARAQAKQIVCQGKAEMINARRLERKE